MSQPEGHHLAQLNVGRLVAPTDDPRVAEFMGALDRINGLGKRIPGFVWMMEGSGEPGTGNTENAIGGDPQFVANLTVWEDAESLETFVWKTVHKQFHDRRHEWFQMLAERYLVMWWIPAGHRPSLDEALERLERLRAHGDTSEAFGWAHLHEAEARKSEGCWPRAAE